GRSDPEREPLVPEGCEDEFGTEALEQPGQQHGGAEVGTEDRLDDSSDEFAQERGTGFADDRTGQGPGEDPQARDEADRGWEGLEREFEDLPAQRQHPEHEPDGDAEHGGGDVVDDAPLL